MKYLTILLTISLCLTAISVQAETQGYVFDNGTGKDSFDDHYQKLDVVSPQSYFVDSRLQLQRKGDDGVTAVAQDKDVKIVPLVFQQGFNRNLMTIILFHSATRSVVINQLVKEAQDEGYAGWQFDFENIAHSDRNKYTAFVQEAAAKFNAADLELSVAVVPRTRPYNAADAYQDWSSAYDYEKLADAADYIVAMAYDNQNGGGPSGSLPFQKEVLSYLTTIVSPQKLQLGVPMYCWKWRVNDGYSKFGALSHQDAAEDLEESLGGTKLYIDRLDSELLVYKVASGNIYFTWCDGVEGFKAKQNLAKQYKLRGISMWALGQENQNIWQEL